jgi:hypothetical protein
VAVSCEHAHLELSFSAEMNTTMPTQANLCCCYFLLLFVTTTNSNIYTNSYSLDGVRLIPLGTSATVGLFYQLRMSDDDDYGAVGGMRIGRGNRSTRGKPAPVPLCPPQILHDLTWDRTRAAEVGSQLLTA